MDEKKQTEPMRPLCLKLDDARNEIFAVINMTAKKHELPFYLLENIVTEAARQVTELAGKERENAARQYEQEVFKFNNQRGESNE